MSFVEGFRFVCSGEFEADGNNAVDVFPHKPITADSIILITPADGVPMAADVPQPRVINRTLANNRFRINCSGDNDNTYKYLMFEPTA